VDDGLDFGHSQLFCAVQFSSVQLGRLERLSKLFFTRESWKKEEEKDLLTFNAHT